MRNRYTYTLLVFSLALAVLFAGCIGGGGNQQAETDGDS